MRIARLQTPEGPQAVRWEEGSWRGIRSIADPVRTSGRWDADTPLLAPCEPAVVVGMSHNGSTADRLLPPQGFLKSTRTVVGPGRAPVIDPVLGQVVVEGELTAVIGRHCGRLEPADALAAVLGFTVADDVTAIDQLALDDHLVQAKNGPGYTPVGPWIETELDWRDLTIRMAIDGREVARGRTSGLAYDVAEVLCYVSRFVELGPGDLVLMGAPGTTVPVDREVSVAIEIEGIGTLRHRIERLPGSVT